MKVFGVDLGQYSVKVAELDVSSKGSILSNFYEFPLSPDPQRDRSLETLEILRRIAGQADPGTRWVIGVPQVRVSVHNKRFPFRERAKIQKSLAFELEDDIPLDIDETIFDAKVIEHLGPFTDVLTVAAPMEAVEETLAICKDGGFDPEIVSVEGLALSNCFEVWDQPIPERAAPVTDQSVATESVGARVILHMGHSHTNMLVYREGSLIAVRTLLWGGGDIVDALTRAFGVPVFEALKVLREKSFILMNSAGATKDQLLLSRTISTAVDVLLRDVKLTLLELRATYTLHYEKVELTGGVSQIQNLGAYVTQGLEIPTNVAHPMQAMQSGQTLRGTRIDVGPNIEAVGSVAIGLALEAAKKPKNPAINLRKGDFARENESLRLFWETWQVPIQVAATAFVLFFIYSVIRDMEATSLNARADDKVTEVVKALTKTDTQLKGLPANETGLSRYIAAQKKKIQDAEALQKAEQLKSAMDLVAALSTKLTIPGPASQNSGIDVSRLHIDNNDVTIEGRVLSPGTPAKVESILRDFAKQGTLKAQPPIGAAAGEGTAFLFKFQIERTL
ncbi:MAG: pilus assembly protein PilM [Bdellovibrionota bacterium]